MLTKGAARYTLVKCLITQINLFGLSRRFEGDHKAEIEKKKTQAEEENADNNHNNALNDILNTDPKGNMDTARGAFSATKQVFQNTAESKKKIREEKAKKASEEGWSYLITMVKFSVINLSYIPYWSVGASGNFDMGGRLFTLIDAANLAYQKNKNKSL